MEYLSQIQGPDDLKKLDQEQLLVLAEEIRQAIVGVVSQTGGHLASNLGAVELAIALHYLYESPTDKIIWDVSHQSYPHKFLTGRQDRIKTLRQYGGLAGYCKRTESEHDFFGAGHASTSISAALGFAKARDLAGEDHHVVAVIGDGAMTGGLAFEGMNNAGSLKSNLLVILNDNTWSISKNVGSISKYLTGIMADEKFQKLRNEVWEMTGRFKRRNKIRETISRLEKSIKNVLVPGMLFEKMGFRYFGPIDGHDLPLLIRTLKDVKGISGPVLLHVATIKGKGFAPAEDDAYSFHGVGQFDKVTGKAAAAGPSLPAYTKVFGNIMVELGKKDERVCAITAAMSSGTGLDNFAKEFPERFFDVGIAEAHAGTFAAGLAAEGHKPFLAVYSTFMQRAYDQVIHDMAIQNLPVTICMDRGGLVGNDGPTHHGAYDLAYLNPIPNVTIAAPKDGNELRSMMYYSTDKITEGIVAIRYPREKVPTEMTDEVEPINWGTWELLTEPADVVVLAVGTMVHRCQKAAERLSADDINIAVVNARFVKPLDLEMLNEIASDARAIVTVEEGTLNGGFGTTIASYLLNHDYAGRFMSLGIPDAFITHGTRDELLDEVGLSTDKITASIKRFCESLSDEQTSGGFLSRFKLRRNGRKKSAQSTYSLTGTDSD